MGPFAAQTRELPDPYSSPAMTTTDGLDALRREIGLGEIARLQKEGKFGGAREVITIDGVRAEYADGFGLARPSNTTPIVVLRFEADNDAALARIQEEFRRELLALKPDAKLPF